MLTANSACHAPCDSAKLGMKICIADLERQGEAMHSDGLHGTAIEPRLLEMGAQGVIFQPTDVADYDSVEALRDAVYGKWDDVGFLFNNAGLGAGRAGFGTNDFAPTMVGFIPDVVVYILKLVGV